MDGRIESGHDAVGEAVEEQGEPGAVRPIAMPPPHVMPGLDPSMDAPGGARFFSNGWTVRSGAVVYAASACGLCGAAGLYGIREPGPNRA